VWKGGTNREEEHLESAVRSALDVAAKLQLESIALPAISSGIFGFPKSRCVEIIVDTIRSFAEHQQTSLRLVRCTNIDDETVKEFQTILETFSY
jgi:putative ATPase